MRFYRSGKLLVTLAMIGFIPPTAGWAQPVHYTFTKIADTIDDARLAGPSCVGMNNHGTVIVVFAGELWRGDGESFSQVSAAVVDICASINDAGEIAYATHDADGWPIFLVRNSNGNLVTLAQSDSFPAFASGRTYLPSLAANGSVLFQGNGNTCGIPGAITGDGIYVVPGLTVYDPICDPLALIPSSVSAGTMNDNLIVAFLAMRPDESAPTGVRTGIYRGSLTALVEDGDPLIGSIGFARPVINNHGTIAFVGASNGAVSIFTTSDGVSFTRVGAPVDNLSGFSINDSGTVAYRGPVTLGAGIFTGPDLTNDKVITPGEPLDGSTFQGGFIWEEGLNNNGQIAFWAELADGRRGVYRADPSACAQDVSASVAVMPQGKLKPPSRKTTRYTQTVSFKNNDGAIAAPVSLVLDSLGSDVTLFAAAGVTSCTTPAGSPYVDVPVGGDGIFSPGERVTVTLEFVNPSGQTITYTTRVLGSGVR